ncbi:MAG: fimbrial assembly protein [Cyanobacteria bacterium SW_9_44_58]|nr:MAG: fimbrial assembly protein [Cyanobacteria bacterium SW_9_44_58]
MYSLDVDFLKKRREDQRPQFEKKTLDEPTFQSAPSIEGNFPLIIGLVVGIGAVVAMGGFWFITTQQTARVQQKINQLEQKLSQAQSKQQQVTQKREELKQAETNLKALANIFNQIKPLSAILEDVRDRAPSNVQIKSFEQSTNESGNQTFTLEGVASTYEAVNYFSLTLQRSPFINPRTVNLQTANKTNLNIELINDTPETGGEQDEEALSPTQVINYQISFEVNDKPASELLEPLQEQGATGLVTRIRTLEEKGIVQ